LLTNLISKEPVLQTR